jgi:glycosyltransferase involved in cell wall biosynthesis
MEPLVTVIMPFYDEEKYIEKSVSCIIDQTYKNLEILLIDDASSDNSLEKVKKINDNRIKIISLEKNIGRAAARNIGIEEAKGKFITLMDSDDECDQHRVERQLETIIRNGENTVCGTWIKIIINGKETLKKLPIDHNEIIKGFNRHFNRVTFVAGTMMASNSIFKEFKYRTKFKYFEDWDLLLRLYESGRVNFLNVPEPLYSYCIRSKSTRAAEDWYDYNIFARNCQHRRLKGECEFDSLEKFNLHLEKNLLESLYYTTLKSMIRVKRKIENY